MTKQELREILKQKRATVSPEEKKRMDGEIVKRIVRSKEFCNASAILLYAPMADEVNLLPLVHAARARGIPVAFPRCNTETHTMRFYVLQPEMRLSPGAYRIPEPPAEAPLCEPDARALCILPALTFDPRGCRLGYGKGYYDRFLADFPGIAVGAVYRQMMLKRVPVEAHDKAVSLIFTDRSVVSCRAAVEKEEKTPKTATQAGSFLQQKIAAFRHAVRAWGKGKAEDSRAVASVQENASGANSAHRTVHAPLILVAAVFLLLLLSRIVDAYLTDRNNEYAVVILLQVFIFLIPAVIYGKWKGERFVKRIRLRAIHPEQLWFVFCMLIVMISGGLLCSVLTGGIASLSGSFTLYDTFVARMTGGAAETVYVILAYGVLPAFGEELIFRAVLCAEYERFGVPVAIAVSALCFSMLHFSFPLFLTYLLLGVLLATAMYATRSFFTAFLLHFCYNLFCLFGQPYLSAFYVNAGSNEIFIFCLIVLFLLFGAFAVGEARKIYHRYARINLDSSYTVSVPFRVFPKQLFYALRSPGVPICIVLWLIASIVKLL